MHQHESFTLQSTEPQGNMLIMLLVFSVDLLMDFILDILHRSSSVVSLIKTQTVRFLENQTSTSSLSSYSCSNSTRTTNHNPYNQILWFLVSFFQVVKIQHIKFHSAPPSCIPPSDCIACCCDSLRPPPKLSLAQLQFLNRLINQCNWGLIYIYIYIQFMLYNENM